MKKFFLRLFFSCEKLNVIDQEHVRIPIAPSEFFHLTMSDRIDDLIGELLRRHVGNPKIAFSHHQISNGMQKVRLPQAYATTNKERVVTISRRVGNGQTGGMGKLVTRPNDKILKGIFSIWCLSSDSIR